MSGNRTTSIALWLVVLGGLGTLGYLWFGPKGGKRDKSSGGAQTVLNVERTLRNARFALEDQKFDEALELAEKVLEQEPNNSKAMVIAGSALGGSKSFKRAIEYFDRVPVNDSSISIRAAFEKAAIEFYFGRASDAHAALGDLLDRAPDHVTGNQLMAELLDLCGHRWESVSYALELARAQQADLRVLMRLADLELSAGRYEQVLQYNERDKNDSFPWMGLARIALAEDNRKVATDLTEALEKSRSDDEETLAQLGRFKMQFTPETFHLWAKTVPKKPEHPGVWRAFARWARLAKQHDAAARCAWEAVTRNPNDPISMQVLGQSLVALGRRDDARPFLDRSVKLSELQRMIRQLVDQERDVPLEAIAAIAKVLEELGRNLEVRNWNQLAEMLQGKPPLPVGRKAPRATNVDEMVALWVDGEVNPAIAIDLSDLPLPSFDAAVDFSTGVFNQEFTARFEDKAQILGIDFTYIPTPDDETDGRRIIETTGGGVAATDFDRDGWPDLYLVQGGWLPAKEKATPRDRFFRNHGDRFEDVTELCGIDCREVGQGLAVGDVNGDGFGDLYVCNLGRNRFYLNNGDGTFSEATAMFADDRTDWSVSAAFVDTTGDGLPELYVANYLSGEEVLSKICVVGGFPFSCGPDGFEAAQDRFFENRGDGTFTDITDDSGIAVPNGKGLGVLAADFFENGLIQFYVANDGVPNFFFAPDGNGDKYSESGLLTGVAVSGESDVQGSMGIAAGDPNLDGRLDLFVTNFQTETNVLYANADGLFEDVTGQVQLAVPGRSMVGFGTQFVDGELDGFPDLLVTNGHVDDYSRIHAAQTTAGSGQAQEGSTTAKPELHRMRNQYFRNLGGTGFGEQKGDQVGRFFDRLQLGRGMARLDWNKDGREDVAISNLDTPANVLTNTSTDTGHFLALRFVGTKSNRDAIGTIVRIHDGDWIRMQQQCGGDGYESSNERRMVFGLSERPVVPKIEIRWLDGSKQTFENVAADKEYVVVQGQDAILHVPK